MAEVADFQDRSPDDVQSEIEQAASQLRRNLMDEQTPDQEKEFERAELRAQRNRK